jgi:hypothetical protein
MGWTELNFAYGSVITSSQMNALHENFAATFAGDSGSPVARFKAFDLTPTNILGSGLAAGATKVLSEGLYMFFVGSGVPGSGPVTQLEFYDGANWVPFTTNADSYSLFTGIFRTFSNNFRIRNTHGSSVDSPNLYRF